MARLRVRAIGFDGAPAWLRDLEVELVDDGADVTLWHPAAPRPAGVTLAFLDRSEDPYGLVHPDAARFVSVRADAYAGDAVGAASALAWIAAGAPRPPRGVVFLGGLGTMACATPVGTALSVDERCLLGRSPDCDLVLRQGAHSDQNLCARRHALLTRVADGIVVTDLRSTNGTRVGDPRVKGPTTATPGDEIRLADCFRVLVRG